MKKQRFSVYGGGHTTNEKTNCGCAESKAHKPTETGIEPLLPFADKEEEKTMHVNSHGMDAPLPDEVQTNENNQVYFPEDEETGEIEPLLPADQQERHFVERKYSPKNKNLKMPENHPLKRNSEDDIEPMASIIL